MIDDLTQAGMQEMLPITEGRTYMSHELCRKLTDDFRWLVSSIEEDGRTAYGLTTDAMRAMGAIDSLSRVDAIFIGSLMRVQREALSRTAAALSSDKRQRRSLLVERVNRAKDELKSFDASGGRYTMSKEQARPLVTGAARDVSNLAWDDIDIQGIKSQIASIQQELDRLQHDDKLQALQDMFAQKSVEHEPMVSACDRLQRSIQERRKVLQDIAQHLSRLQNGFEQEERIIGERLGPVNHILGQFAFGEHRNHLSVVPKEGRSRTFVGSEESFASSRHWQPPLTSQTRMRSTGSIASWASS